jgi:3-keto-disaccharide hydrolase
MTKTLLAFALFASTLALAQTPGANLGYTDTPMLPGLPYHVHDPARPHPPVVTPGAQPGAAPSDATVLFSGTDLSQWTSTKQPAPAEATAGRPWKVENGYVEVVPNAGDIRTIQKFGDVQLHIEWAAPASVRGTSQNRGNSGIFLQGRYEVQVLDSFENPTYADGQAGAIYGQWPPLVNPVRKPGEWQAYDIVFEAPRFEGGKVVTPAYLTVFLNGVLLHHRKDVMGPTVHRALASYAAQPAEDSLVLQDHQQPVRYRNIWIRRLAPYDKP